jgi:hypothetical protein
MSRTGRFSQTIRPTSNVLWRLGSKTGVYRHGRLYIKFLANRFWTQGRSRPPTESHTLVLWSGHLHHRRSLLATLPQYPPPQFRQVTGLGTRSVRAVCTEAHLAHTQGRLHCRLATSLPPTEHGHQHRLHSGARNGLSRW